MSTVEVQARRRRDQAADWTATNPTLAEGEIGVEVDTGYLKIGDGTTAWTALPYYHGPPWFQGIGGGEPDSTYPGAPFNPHGMMGTDPGPSVPLSTEGDPAWANLGIYGVGFDGDDTLLAGVIEFPSFGKRLYVSDASLSAPTVVNMADITGWTDGTFKEFHHIEYSSSLDIWIAACGRAQFFWCEDDPAVAANWNLIPEPTEWSDASFLNIKNLFWDTGLEMFSMGMDTGFNRAEMIVSIDGKNWSIWDDHQVLGGSEPDNIIVQRNWTFGGNPFHMFFQQEEYVYKLNNSGAGVLSGAAQGWTKTPNNGVIRTTAAINVNHLATDGNSIVISCRNEINASINVASHPDGWGPDGNSNRGWQDTDMGWATFNEGKTVFMYLSDYARPWIVFRQGTGTIPDPADEGWWDAESITYNAIRTAANAPQFARCTVEPFVSFNATMDGGGPNDYLYRPAPHALKGGDNANFMMRNDPASAYGENGYWIVMRTDISRQNDFLVFRKAL